MSHQLDKTDLDILKLIAEDKTKKEIAPLVFKSVSTVKARIEKLKEKAGCSSNAALVMFFREQIELLQTG